MTSTITLGDVFTLLCCLVGKTAPLGPQNVGRKKYFRICYREMGLPLFGSREIERTIQSEINTKDFSLIFSISGHDA